MMIHTVKWMRLPLVVSAAHPLKLMLFSLIAIALTGCSGKDNRGNSGHSDDMDRISEVANSYLDGMRTAEFKSRADIITLSHQPSDAEKAAICNMLETKVATLTRRHGGCASIDIRGQYINSGYDSALVIYTKEYNDGEQVLDSLHIIKRGDNWKIDISQ